MDDMDMPLIQFDFNQKVYVYTDDEEISYIPCTPFDESCFISRIPDKTWITYRGLARFCGEYFLRFLYEGEQVYVSPSMMPYLEDIRQRMPGEKPKVRRSKPRKKKSKRKFIMAGSVRAKSISKKSRRRR